LNEVQFILFLKKEKDTIFTHSTLSFSFLRTLRPDLLFLPMPDQLCRYHHCFNPMNYEGGVRACNVSNEKKLEEDEETI